MIPVLYAASETEFETNGIGILAQAIDCIVTQGLDGNYYLELKYPVTGIHFSKLRRRAIVLAEPDPETEPQPFRVYRITKPMGGVVTVYAKHWTYETLTGITVKPFSAVNAAAAFTGLKDNAVKDCPLTLWTNIEQEGEFKISAPTPMWTAMGGGDGAIQDVFGGEYEFTRYQVNLWTRRGEDRGVSIRYGKNLTSLEQDENCADCYTAVHPYWTGAGDKMLQLPEYYIQAAGNYGYTRIMPLDLSRVWSEEPTEEQIRAYTEQYIVDNNIGVPVVSWKIQFAQLEQTEEYKGRAILERVALGDTVHVEFAEMGISTSARVIEVKYKPILGRYESVTLGEAKANIAATIAEKATKSFAETAAKKEVDAQTHASIFNKLTNGGKIQGIWTENDVWYISAQIAKIVNLTADMIVAGVLRSKDLNTYFDLDTGELLTKSENGRTMAFRNGDLTLSDANCAKRLKVTQSEEHQILILLYDVDEKPMGGFGADEDFWLYAWDYDENDTVGRKAGWQTINGVKTLVAY